MRLQASQLSFAILCTSLGACADGTAPLVTQSDSSGITIVTNSPEGMAAGPEWSLSDEPVFEFGGEVDAPIPLLHVTAVEPLGRGRVAIGMNAPPQVLVLDADGELELLLGRQGDGPGEYATVYSVVRMIGDSIGVWDPYRRRLTVFDPDGEAERDVDLSSIVPIPIGAAANSDVAGGFTRILGTTAPTLILFGEGGIAPVSEPTVSRPSMPSFWVDSDGVVQAESPPVPGMEVSLGSPIGPIPIPFGARTYAASQGENLVVGTSGKTEFEVFGPGGTLEQIVRWPDVPREVGGTYLETWEAMAAEWTDESPDLAILLEAVPRAAQWPAYLDLISSDLGEVMIGEYPGPTGVWPMRRDDDKPDLLRPQLRMPEREWLVFDPGGVYRASFRTPEGFEPYTAHDGLVWGVYTDELDVESVRAYELVR